MNGFFRDRGQVKTVEWQEADDGSPESIHLGRCAAWERAGIALRCPEPVDQFRESVEMYSALLRVQGLS